MDEKKTTSSGDSQDVVDSHNLVVSSTYIKPQGRKTHDPDVTFEEYYYYAQKTREEQKTLQSPGFKIREILNRTRVEDDNGPEHPTTQQTRGLTGKDFANREYRLEISDEEWSDASRAFRTASWGAGK